MRQPRDMVLVAALAGICLAGGCGQEQQPATGAGVALTPEVDPSQGVARVNDRPITAGDLRQQMRSGKDRGAALQELIEQELLAQEAERRGYHRQPSIGKLQRKAMARRLIQREFGDKFTKASIPDDLIDVTYKRMLGYFVHLENVFVWHYVVLARKKRTSRETQQKATAVCKEIHRRATRARLTLAQFKAIKDGLAPVKEPIKVLLQTYTTGAKGPAVLPFAQAAFALEREGDISPVVETMFGCHVIYFGKRHAAKDTSRSQAEAEIRDKIFTKAREEMFNRWAAKLEQGYKISVKPEVLDKVHKRPPVKKK